MSAALADFFQSASTSTVRRFTLGNCFRSAREARSKNAACVSPCIGASEAAFFGGLIVAVLIVGSVILVIYGVSKISFDPDAEFYVTSPMNSLRDFLILMLYTIPSVVFLLWDRRQPKA